MFSTLVMRSIAESCDISFKLILFLSQTNPRDDVRNKKIKENLLKCHDFSTDFLSILAESSLGSMTSTAHPSDSSACNCSNSSSLFSSFKVFESTVTRIKSRSISIAYHSSRKLVKCKLQVIFSNFPKIRATN